MSKKVTKRISMVLLAIMFLLFMGGCVVVLNNNMGHHIQVKKQHSIDDMKIDKDYDAELKRR